MSVAQFQTLTAILIAIFGLLSGILVYIVRMAVSWTRLKDSLVEVIADLKSLTEAKEKEHTDLRARLGVLERFMYAVQGRSRRSRLFSGE